MSDRPGVEKFHDDHKQMCEICRGLDEALVEAHARLSDRVAEVERLRALAEQRLKHREYWQERNAEKETENDRLRRDLARADSDAQALYEAEVERLREECEIGARRNRTMEETIERLRAHDAQMTTQVVNFKAEVERLRATPNRENPELRQRMVGLAKAIDEEMQPGAREFALAAVSDFIDERDALYRKQDELETEVARLRAYSEAMEHEVSENAKTIERLRAALNRAGDRLAQVQPGVTEPWAFGIVPKAEQEIADALAEEKE
jgi:chromosome segregation ATPase